MNEHRIWRWSLAACAGLIGVGLFTMTEPAADARRPAADAKCCAALLDLNGVLTSLDERAVRERELQEFIQAQTAKLDELKRSAQAAQDDLKVLPERSRDWESKREEAVRLAMRYEGEEKLAKALVDDKRKKLSLDLFNKIRESAGRYAQREGYTLVINNDSEVQIPIDMSEQQVQAAMVSRRVLYRADGAEISQAVAQMMNTEFKAR